MHNQHTKYFFFRGFLRKLLKIISIVVISTIGLLLVIILYVRLVATIDPPEPEDLSCLTWQRKQIQDSVFIVGSNWFKSTSTGLHEMYVEGNAFERGVANGKLSQELVQYQEKVFNDQINKLVPSTIQRYFLKYFVGWFNRNLDKEVKEEYKMEIFGVSRAASDEYDHVAPAYQRMLNYHAAHDIGHALQNMSLVGCTSFATWGDRSEEGSLIVGRNFDFYVGEEFAQYKIVSFVNPREGHGFVMITFPGMIGVLSGMNDTGLTVTINAAKSEIPSSSATPVSLVAREVLQYASSIDEAYLIIKKQKMFVAESFLIGSANDKKAAIIEKTPEAIAVFYPESEYLVCTNHFQSDRLGGTELNKEHERTSASPYRHSRVEELLNGVEKNTVETTASILRNRLGLKNEDIGLGNEKAINQLVSHHSVIFQPEKLRLWVSTSPWQLGKFICYDLSKGFTGLRSNHTLRATDRDITADAFVGSPELEKYRKFSKYRFPFNSREGMTPDSLVNWNPKSYLSYMLAGDCSYNNNDFKKAIKFYEQGLHLEIASDAERKHMEINLERCKENHK